MQIWTIGENQISHNIYFLFSSTAKSGGNVTHGIRKVNSHNAYNIKGLVLGLCVLSVDNNSESILICADEVANNKRGLATFSNINEMWSKMGGLRFEPYDNSPSLHMVEVLAGQVICGELLGAPSNMLYIFQASQNLQVKFIAGHHVSGGYITFDARFVKDQTILALVSGKDENAHVRLCSLSQTNSLQELSSININGIDKILWFEDRIMAGQWNSRKGSHSVFEIQYFGNSLSKRDLLIDDCNIFRWWVSDKCIAILADN